MKLRTTAGVSIHQIQVHESCAYIYFLWLDEAGDDRQGSIFVEIAEYILKTIHLYIFF